MDFLRELELEVFIGLIPFDPDTSIDELEETIEFLYSMGELNISLFRKRMMCLPGSGVERSMLEQNRLEHGKYTISDTVTERICRIMEAAGKNWGNQLNCYLYNSLWRRAIADRARGKDREVLQQARDEVNKKSKGILETVIYSVREDKEEETAIIERAEREMENLYQGVFRILEQMEV